MLLGFGSMSLEPLGFRARGGKCLPRAGLSNLGRGSARRRTHLFSLPLESDGLQPALPCEAYTASNHHPSSQAKGAQGTKAHGHQKISGGRGRADCWPGCRCEPGSSAQSGRLLQGRSIRAASQKSPQQSLPLNLKQLRTCPLQSCCNKAQNGSEIDTQAP